MNQSMNIINYFYRQILLSGFLLFSANVAAIEIEPPHLMLKRASDEVRQALIKQHDMLDTEPERIYEIVSKYIIPNLDDVTMAKLAIGKNWRKANNDQKIAFVDEFRLLLVSTYGKSLKEFDDQKIEFYPAKISENSKRVVVKSQVTPEGGAAIPVTYKMRVKNNAWKVYDISIDGVSLVTSYRGTFSQEVRKGGIEGLLSMLRKRNHRPESK